MKRLNNFLIIDATDRRKISSDQKRLFIAVSLYPVSFFTNTPFKKGKKKWKSRILCGKERRNGKVGYHVEKEKVMKG